MIEAYLTSIESEIRKQRFGSQPKSLYDPIQYIMTLGGKRMRPLLTMLSYSIYRQDTDTIVPYAVAVEAFHNFTLMHDDIMDNAPLRRGKVTVHKKWNINTAILSGDVMLVKVYEIFQSLEAQKLREVLRLFNECATGVCEGQQWDMMFESKARVTETEYLEMIRLKTAVLLGFSLELGAVLAGAPEKDRLNLREVGVNLGLGFQLKDDLLDVYADKKKFGKQVGGDIIANKKTFLLIKAQEKSKGKDRRELAQWLSRTKFDKKRKVSAITAVYNRLGIKSITEKKISEYFDRAFSGMNRISAPGAKTLVAFARGLAERQK